MSLDKRSGYRGLPTTLALGCLASAVACASAGQPPQLNGLSDQVAQVGVELRLELDATNSQGGKVSYAYNAADLTDLTGNASISVAPSGAGEFRWTPLAADIGSHAFDFTVTDGKSNSTTTINIDVKAVVGGAAVFRQPLGSGTTIDVSKQMCLDLDVVVDDQAAATVKLAQENPVIDGATLTTIDGQHAKWHWCPSAAQKSESRYTLVLSAADGVNPKVIKDYLIVLRGGTPACPGSGPTITTTPADQTTRLDLQLSAEISDTLALKGMPLLYYSSTDPGAMPDVSTMTQVSATLTSGTAMDGQYAATVPNPVATMSDGATATIYYVFGADDHDSTNNCDHVTQSPVYKMTVTAGGTSTVGLCQPCTADSQCGAGNECVTVGNLGGSYCLAACGTGCATGYTCSTSNVTSVGGASAPQCEPSSGTCTMTTTCTPDLWAPNQTLVQAEINPTMAPGNWTSLVSCPDPNSTYRALDDWFEIEVDQKSKVSIQIAGDGSIELDLFLYNASGSYIDSSDIYFTDRQSISDCLQPGFYYVKVPGWGYARDVYSLNLVQTVGGC